MSDRYEEAMRLLRRASNLGLHAACQLAAGHGGRPCSSCALTIEIAAFVSASDEGATA